MSFELPGAGVPEDIVCRYGASRLMCRGPRRSLGRPYIAFLGGGETFGRFVDRPFAQLVEGDIGLPCVNLGSLGSGPQAYLRDPDIMAVARGARLAVVQVSGAQNLSNRFYRVHPRRNDRFLAPSPRLRALYREVDFTDFHFNLHLLNVLNGISAGRFATVREELQRVWLSHMRRLIGGLARKPVLLWLRYLPRMQGADGGAGGGGAGGDALGGEPALVGRALLARLEPDIACLVEMRVERTGHPDDLAAMRFGPLQAPAAARMIGPQMHRRIADALGAALRGLL